MLGCIGLLVTSLPDSQSLYRLYELAIICNLQFRIISFTFRKYSVLFFRRYQKFVCSCKKVNLIIEGLLRDIIIIFFYLRGTVPKNSILEIFQFLQTFSTKIGQKVAIHPAKKNIRISFCMPNRERTMRPPEVPKP